MATFLSSPVWASIISVAGAALVGLVTMMYRVLGKVSRIEDKVDGVVADVNEIKSDQNIVRWSDLAQNRGRRKRNGF